MYLGILWSPAYLYTNELWVISHPSGHLSCGARNDPACNSMEYINSEFGLESSEDAPAHL